MDDWQILPTQDGGNEKCQHNQPEKTIMALSDLSYDPVNFVWHSWTSSCFFEDFENCSVSQVGKVLPECGWSKPLVGEILKDTPCYYSRTELRMIVWSLQSFYLYRQTLSPLKNSALFQKSQKGLCIALFFWCNKERLKVKFLRCYRWMNSLISVEFWVHFRTHFSWCCHEESSREIWPLLCSEPLCSSSWGSSH